MVDEDVGGEERRGQTGGELKQGRNYKVDMFNRRLKSNHLPKGIREE